MFVCEWYCVSRRSEAGVVMSPLGESCCSLREVNKAPLARHVIVENAAHQRQQRGDLKKQYSENNTYTKSRVLDQGHKQAKLRQHYRESTHQLAWTYLKMNSSPAYEVWLVYVLVAHVTHRDTVSADGIRSCVRELV